jgi:hypothetical protein
MSVNEQFPLPMPIGDYGQAIHRLVLLPAAWLSDWGIFPPPKTAVRVSQVGSPIATVFYKGEPNEYTLEIGGFSPMGPLQEAGPVKNNPSWSIDHLRVFAALLTFVSKRYNQPEVDISWRALFVRMGMPSHPNARTRSYWRNICVEVLVTFFRVRRPGATTITTAQIAEKKFVKILFGDGVEMGENIRGLAFSPDFLAALWPGIDREDRTQVRDLNQTAFASFRFPLSRMLYLVLGRHAAFRTKTNPYRRNLAGLLSDCGWPVPAKSRGSWRLRIIAGRDLHSGVLAELDGASMLNGTLRMEIRKSIDWIAQSGNPADWDYVVRAWCEGRVAKGEELRPERATKHQLARLSGLSDTDYMALCRRAGRRLSEEDVSLLKAAGFHDWQGSEIFLARVKYFLGVSRFHEEIGDTKMHRDSGRPFSRNPSARIIGDLLRAVEGVADSRKNSLRA